VSRPSETFRPLPIRLDVDWAELLDQLAERVADRLLERIDAGPPTPWMLMEEAIAYTRIPDGTFRKWVAEGRIPAHGGKRKLFHRVELDAALGYGSPKDSALMPRPRVLHGP
jgi:excisionase family DNA binding protein